MKTHDLFYGGGLLLTLLIYWNPTPAAQVAGNQPENNQSAKSATLNILLSDEQFEKGIGAAEGTVNWDTLEPDEDYNGHPDPCVLNRTCPGRGTNRGYFSSDYGSTPEEANAYQLKKLHTYQRAIQEEAIAEFGHPLSQAALINAADLVNQSETAGWDFVELITTHDPTPEQIVDARVQAYYDPVTQQLDAPGLGNNRPAVIEDQKRRTGATLHALSKLNE